MVEKTLMGKKIANMLHFKIGSNLVVEFARNIYLDLFHDSNYFGGGQLRGDNGVYLVSLPGSSYSE
jgi:hypothetical protein